MTLLRDLIFAFRVLGNDRLNSAITIATLASCIGANTAVFSAIEVTLLRPLPYLDPDRLVLIWEKNFSGKMVGGEQVAASPADFLEWQRDNRVFSGVAAYQREYLNITGYAEPERVLGTRCSSNLFSVLGVQAAQGRTFTPGDQAERPAVLSHSYWHTRFGSAPVIGRKIVLNGVPYEIVGVMPSKFEIANSEGWSDTAGVLIPFDLTPAQFGKRQLGNRALTVVARLKDRVDLARAQEDMESIAARIARDYPETNRNFGVIVVPIRTYVSGKMQQPLLILMAATSLVLIIGFVNIIHIQFARAAAREREIAIRVSLGCTRWRMARLLFTESLLITVTGATIGVLMGRWVTQILVAVRPNAIPRSDELGINSTILVFALLTVVVTSLLLGFVPLLHSLRPNLNSMLNGSGSRSSSGTFARNLRNALIGVEVAVATVLVIEAVLLGTTFRKLMSVRLGFDSDNVLTGSITLPASRYSTPTDTDWFYKRLRTRLMDVPAIEQVGYTSGLPLVSITTIFFMREPPGSDGERLSAASLNVGPGFFESMGIRLLKGRYFNDQDLANHQHVIVNETMARIFWRGQDAIGQRIKTFGDEPQYWHTVVGIVEDVHHFGVDEAPQPTVFWTYAPPSSDIVIRSSTNVAPVLRRELKAIDADLPVYNVRTMRQVVDRSLSRRKFSTLLMELFAGLALVLLAAGLYGVISYLATQRIRETGIRMALGARPQDIVGIICVESFKVVGVGIVVGLAASAFIIPASAHLMFGAQNLHMGIYVAASLMVAAICLTASLVPAKRLSTLDPARALRTTN